MNQATVARPKPKPWEYRTAKVTRQVNTVEAVPAAQEAELLLRHHLGLMDIKVHRRLSALFENPLADITERFLRACTYLNITGADVEVYASAAYYRQALARLKARIEADTWAIDNLVVLQAYLVRANAGDSQALLAVLGYVALCGA